MVVDKESTESVGEDALCTVCEMAVVWMKSQLKNEGVKDKVFEYVNQVIILKCMHLLRGSESCYSETSSLFGSFAIRYQLQEVNL